MTRIERKTANAITQPRPSSVDRSVIRELLKLSFADRARLAVMEARNLAAFDARLERNKRP